MENDRIEEFIDRKVKEKIKERDGYKLTGFAFGTAMLQGVRLLSIALLSEGVEYVNYSRLLFYGGSIVFLVSLFHNIKGLCQYRSKGKAVQLKKILEMLIIIFISFIAAMLLWYNANAFIGAH